MSRIRTVKPEWLDDERLVCASDAARVLSIALITLADDHGRGRASVVLLGGRVFPNHANPREHAARAREELVSARYVLVYEVDGQEYYQIRNWAKHQRVDRPSASQLPPPPPDSEQKPLCCATPANVREDAPSPRDGLATDLDQDHGPLPGPGPLPPAPERGTPMDPLKPQRGLLLRAHRRRYSEATGHDVPPAKNSPADIAELLPWLVGYAQKTGQTFEQAAEAVLERWWKDPYAAGKGWPLWHLAKHVDEFAEALPPALTVAKGGMEPAMSHAEHAAEAAAGGSPWS